MRGARCCAMCLHAPPSSSAAASHCAIAQWGPGECKNRALHQHPFALVAEPWFHGAQGPPTRATRASRSPCTGTLRTSDLETIAVAHRLPQAALVYHFPPSTTSRSLPPDCTTKLTHGASKAQADQRCGVDVLEWNDASIGGDSSSLFPCAGLEPDPRACSPLTCARLGISAFCRFLTLCGNFCAKVTAGLAWPCSWPVLRSVCAARHCFAPRTRRSGPRNGSESCLSTLPSLYSLALDARAQTTSHAGSACRRRP